MILFGSPAAGGGPAESRWLAPVDGLWTDAELWSDGVPGGATRAVFDALGAPYLVERELGDVSIANLVVDSPDATLSFGDRCEVDVAGLAEIRRGAVEFVGYASPGGQGVVGGLWIVADDARLLVQDATIGNATILGNVEAARDIAIGPGAVISGALVGGADIRVGLADGEVRVLDFNLDGDHRLAVETPWNGFEVLPTLVFGPGMLARFGQTGGIFQRSSGDEPVHFRNEGTIWLDGTAAIFRVETFANDGLVVIDNGAQATLGGLFSNSGAVLINGSELTVRSGTTADLGELDNRGFVRIIGLDNTGDELHLDDPAGAWELTGDIVGGRLTVAPGIAVTTYASFADIVIDVPPDFLTRESVSTRLGDGVEWLGGPIDFSGTLRLSGRHTIPGIAGGATAGSIYLDDSYSIAFDIDLRGSQPRLLIESGTQATIEEGATVSGHNVIIQLANSPSSGGLLNNGVLRAGAGDTITAFGTNFGVVNEGLIDIAEGGMMALSYASLRNPGVVRIAEGGSFSWGTNSSNTVTREDLGVIENNGSFWLYAPLDVSDGPPLSLSSGSWNFRSILGGAQVDVGEDATLVIGNNSSLDAVVNCDGLLIIGNASSAGVELDLVLSSSSRTEIRFRGAGDSPSHGSLAVGRDAVLAGSLVVDLLGFEPEYNEFGTVQILGVLGSTSGDFDRIEVIGPVSAHASFDPETGRLTVLPGCGPADFAEPFDQIDLQDIVGFVTAWQAQDTRSDLNGDGLWDLADVVLFVTAFTAGCP